MTARPEATTLLAFSAMVLIGGLNFVAVRFSNEGLPPFWGAAVRFLAAALLFLALVAALRVAPPRGSRAVTGVVVYGVLSFAAAYAFAYYALTRVSAGLAAVLMALVPLLTLLLAALHRVETLRARGVAGALLSAAGVGIVFRGQLGADVPVAHLLAMLATAAVAAETGVVVKRFPRVHPAGANALGMAVGGLLLLLLSGAAGEAHELPVDARTWLVVAYLVTVGSLGLFFLYRFVLDRWTASATNYMFVLTPLVAIPLGAWLAGEAVTLTFLLGSAVVLVGVYVGAMAGHRRPAPAPPAPTEQAAAK